MTGLFAAATAEVRKDDIDAEHKGYTIFAGDVEQLTARVDALAEGFETMEDTFIASAVAITPATPKAIVEDRENKGSN
eukprot:11865964-Prorocentrum_lima.AAC.1